MSNQDGRVYRLSVVLDSEGGVRADRDRQADLAHFVDGWMRNIEQQQGL